MKIQINTDSNISGRKIMAVHVSGVVEQALNRYADRLTRVEVHLSDENGHDSQRCMIEARLEGRNPTAVTHCATTVDQAVHGALDKLKRSLGSSLGRLEDRR